MKNIHSNYHPPPDTRNVRQFQYLSMMIHCKGVEMSYDDITSQFPFKFSRVVPCIYAMYVHDSIVIFVLSIKTRQGKETVQLWTILYSKLVKHDHKIQHFILDNECSTNMKKVFSKYKLNF